MKYDFTTIPERKGKDAIAVDLPSEKKGAFTGFDLKEGYDVIPMWVADMNFLCLPKIQEEIHKRVDHPTFGYFNPRPEYFESIIRWQKDRHGVTGLEPKHIGYENGVLGGVISALNVLCSKGDNVLVHSPTYVGFTHVLENNGYNIVHSALYRDEEGTWRMNYEDMEKKIVENKIHAAIICNPHNPCGRVWTKEELLKVMEIFEKHHVWVIADEIWSDLMINGSEHITVQSVNEYAKYHTVGMYAPSKTFNLAGLIGSYHIIYNDWLRDRVEKEGSLAGYNSQNVLSMYGLLGAYSLEGEQWCDELTSVLSDNVNFAYDYIQENFKGITLAKPQGTYMLFLHCEDFCKEHSIDMDTLIRKGWEVGVFWQDGRPFHDPYGIRMNLALPTTKVKEAFQRLNDSIFNK